MNAEIRKRPVSYTHLDVYKRQGTNMALTIQFAAKEVSKLQSNDLSKVADAASSGSLMGARGNSGVILSQLFRGFAKACKRCV